MNRRRRHIALAVLIVVLAGSDAADAQIPSGQPAAAAEPREGTLTVETDAACELRVGDAPQVTVLQGKPYSITLSPGQTAIECTSTTSPEAKVKASGDVAAGKKTVVALEFADQIVSRMCSGKPATLADLGGGILRHCVSKTDWTQSDPGSDVSWEKARNACTEKGSGWELPSGNELSELIDRSGRSSTVCGKFTCNVSPHFKLTASSFWAKDETGPEMRMLVNLMLGQQHPAHAVLDTGYRMLCVRHQPR